MTHRAESTKATGSTETTETSDERTHPLLRVVKGSPTDDELAALTAVVAALASARADTGSRKTGPASRWAD
ncbi:hypothetical protein SZMC14600_20229, partial [Saccharomonospora azurea SZMC 14600]